MSLNKWIHPRNPYRTPPDFRELAVKYPDFRKFATQDLKGKITIDFKNPAAVRALTLSLLHKDFSLNVSIPDDHLVPTLTLRLNYLLWVQDLLSLLPATNTRPTGLDIGTGSSCIYPLLAVKHLGWDMLATESEPANCDSAVRNVENNELTQRIKVRKVEKGDRIFDSALADGETVEFSMCNPPFFSEERVEEDDEGESGGGKE